MSTFNMSGFRLVNRLIYTAILGVIICVTLLMAGFASAKGLHLSYPPREHQTTSDRIFFIGTAPTNAEVTINGKVIQRSPQGHFAPSLPLELGDNIFSLRYQAQEITVKVKRLPLLPSPPRELGFVSQSLKPDQNLQVQENEQVCFEAIATPQQKVHVVIGGKSIALAPLNTPLLPPNSAVLTGTNLPMLTLDIAGRYRGCTSFATTGNLGHAKYVITNGKQSVTANSPYTIQVLDNSTIKVAVVKTDNAITRTGPSSDFARLTPLPRGVQAQITGKSGAWWRLSYGAWIADSDVEIKTANFLPKSMVRGMQVVSPKNKADGWSEVQIPLEVALPFSIAQEQDRLRVTVHQATAQTDTIKQAEFQDQAIASVTWEQSQPQSVTYTIQTKRPQQWGYKALYRGTTLVIAVRHPPQSLQSVSVVIDAGHGGPDDLGAVSPTSYREKDATLAIARLVEKELTKRGAKVIMTRTADVDLDLAPRVAIINRTEPTLALSLHYNALPDNGDAEKVAGIGTFWYHPQSRDLGVFLHKYLVTKLKRPDYGIYWGNLALARPTVAPCLLLELGFMINPTEFDWIVNPAAQQQLASAIADGVFAWLKASLS